MQDLPEDLNDASMRAWYLLAATLLSACATGPAGTSSTIAATKPPVNPTIRSTAMGAPARHADGRELRKGNLEDYPERPGAAPRATRRPGRALGAGEQAGDRGVGQQHPLARHRRRAIVDGGLRSRRYRPEENADGSHPSAPPAAGSEAGVTGATRLPSPTRSPRPGRGRTISSISQIASRVLTGSSPSPWPQGEGKGEGSPKGTLSSTFPGSSAATSCLPSPSTPGRCGG